MVEVTGATTTLRRNRIAACRLMINTGRRKPCGLKV